MDRNAFIKLLHRSHWNETVLTLLRDESAARCVVDTGIRDNTTNEVDYNVWNRKVQQSQMEVSIINLLINYIKGNFPAATTVPTAPTSAAASTGPTTSSTEPTTLAASSTAPNSSTTTTSHMINPHQSCRPGLVPARPGLLSRLNFENLAWPDPSSQYIRPGTGQARPRFLAWL